MKKGIGSLRIISISSFRSGQRIVDRPQLSRVRMPVSRKKRAPVAALLSRPDKVSSKNPPHRLPQIHISNQQPSSSMAGNEAATLSETRLGFLKLVRGDFDGAIACFEQAYELRQRQCKSINNKGTLACIAQEALAQSALDLGFALSKRGLMNQAASNLAEAQVAPAKANSELGIRMGLYLPGDEADAQSALLMVYGKRTLLRRCSKELSDWLTSH